MIFTIVLAELCNITFSLIWLLSCFSLVLLPLLSQRAVAQVYVRWDVRWFGCWLGNVAANLFGVATISLPTDAVTEVVVIVRPVVAVLFEIRYYLCVAKAFELVARWYISILAWPYPSLQSYLRSLTKLEDFEPILATASRILLVDDSNNPTNSPLGN